jgi:hypothetical protein
MGEGISENRPLAHYSGLNHDDYQGVDQGKTSSEWAKTGQIPLKSQPTPPKIAVLWVFGVLGRGILFYFSSGDFGRTKFHARSRLVSAARAGMVFYSPCPYK